MAGAGLTPLNHPAGKDPLPVLPLLPVNGYPAARAPVRAGQDDRDGPVPAQNKIVDNSPSHGADQVDKREDKRGEACGLTHNNSSFSAPAEIHPHSTPPLPGLDQPGCPASQWS